MLDSSFECGLVRNFSLGYDLQDLFLECVLVCDSSLGCCLDRNSSLWYNLFYDLYFGSDLVHYLSLSMILFMICLWAVVLFVIYVWNVFPVHYLL